jgi:hypothetical protein
MVTKRKTLDVRVEGLTKIVGHVVTDGDGKVFLDIGAGSSQTSDNDRSKSDPLQK